MSQAGRWNNDHAGHQGGRVTVVGSINVDVIAQAERHPVPGETVPGTGVAVAAGGKGANQAVAAALRGAEVSLVGAVGDDHFQEAALTHLRTAGVDISRVQAHPGATGMALITVSRAGENSIVVVPGVNAEVRGVTVTRHSDLLGGSDVVLVQGEIPRESIEIASTLAGGRFVLNLAPAVEIAPSVLKRADPLVVNEHEVQAAAALMGIGAGLDAESAAAELVRCGVPSVVLTLGSEGATVAMLNSANFVDVVRLPAPVVTAVDTTGAGDAFTGALVAELALGRSLREAAASAARVGAYSVRRPGAQMSYPRRDDDLPEVQGEKS